MAAVLLVSAVYLYLQTFILPAVPQIAGGDQGIHLSLAARMFDGQLIYRDYDHFPMPGTDLVYLLLFKLFGVHAWIAPAMLIVLGVVITWLSIKVSEKVMSGTAVLMPGILFLTLPFPGYLDATHHWFSTCAGTAAVLAVMEERTNVRSACAGVLWGLATFFSQSAIVGALAIAFMLFWERYRCARSASWLLKREACLFAGLFASLIVFDAYFVWKVGLKRFFGDTVVFLASNYSADWFNQSRIYMADPPSIHLYSQWPNVLAFLLVHIVVPLVYVLLLVRYWREASKRPDEPWDRLMLLSLTGLFLFVSVVHAAGTPRMYTISLPALILLVWFLQQPYGLERSLLRALVATTVVLLVARPLIIQTRWNKFLDLPTGRTAFADAPVLYDKCKWTAERTQPGDYFLDDPQLCFALRLRDPSRVPFLRPTAYTTPEQVQDAVEQLAKHHVKFVGWYASLESEINDRAGDHLGPLRRYLKEHYHLAQRFSNNDEIWQLNE